MQRQPTANAKAPIVACKGCINCAQEQHLKHAKPASVSRTDAIKDRIVRYNTYMKYA